MFSSCLRAGVSRASPRRPAGGPARRPDRRARAATSAAAEREATPKNSAERPQGPTAGPEQTEAAGHAARGDGAARGPETPTPPSLRPSPPGERKVPDAAERRPPSRARHACQQRNCIKSGTPLLMQANLLTGMPCWTWVAEAELFGRTRKSAGIFGRERSEASMSFVRRHDAAGQAEAGRAASMDCERPGWWEGAAAPGGQRTQSGREANAAWPAVDPEETAAIGRPKHLTGMF